MGQYFKVIALLGRSNNTVIGYCEPHSYGNGAKLMEHSWLRNNFVSSVESLLIKGGLWYRKPIVWGGDYADVEKGEPSRDEGGNNLNSFSDNVEELKPDVEIDVNEYPYIVNYTKKQYVDKRNVLSDGEYRIHPLPLLTCEGNGRGGGDFSYKDTNNIVGSWSRNHIGIEKEIPEGFKVLKFDLIEKY